MPTRYKDRIYKEQEKKKQGTYKLPVLQSIEPPPEQGKRLDATLKEQVCFPNGILNSF